MGRDPHESDECAGASRPPSVEACIDLTSRRMARASADLASTTDGPSVIDLDGAGAPRQVTVAEGRLSALLDARRRSAEGGVADPATAITVVLEEWEAALAHAEQLGPSWEAYRSGGVDELRGLLVDLRGDDRPRPR